MSKTNNIQFFRHPPSKYAGTLTPTCLLPLKCRSLPATLTCQNFIILIHNNFKQFQKMKITTAYTEAYLQYGKEILSTPLHDSLQQKIIELLPSNFNGEDIGSPNCSYSDQLVQKAAEMGKQGKFVVVDPYPLQSRVIESFGQDYVRQPCEKPVDLIIMKFVLHLVPNALEFLQNIHKRLSDNGMFVVVNLTAKTTFPWGEVVQKGFQLSVFDEAKFQGVKDLFEIKAEREEFNKFVSRESLIGLVKNRSWTNLYSNSDEELRDSVEILEALPEEPVPATLAMNVYYLRKIK